MNIITFIIISYLIAVSSVHTIFAQDTSDTPSDTATLTPTINQVDDLKERLATKVAELKQVQQKAISGAVKAVSISTATIETTSGEVKIELTDTLKVIQVINGKRTELTTDDVDVGDTVVVFGQYDATLELLKAQVLFIQGDLPKRVSGTITDINREDYTITITTTQEEIYTIDIEKNTQMNVYTPDKGVSKGGFSKLTTGTVAHVVGTVNAKDDKRLSAKRFLDLGTIGEPSSTPSPEPAAENTEEPSPTPES